MRARHVCPFYTCQSLHIANPMQSSLEASQKAQKAHSTVKSATSFSTASLKSKSVQSQYKAQSLAMPAAQQMPSGCITTTVHACQTPAVVCQLQCQYAQSCHVTCHQASTVVHKWPTGQSQQASRYAVSHLHAQTPISWR